MEYSNIKYGNNQSALKIGNMSLTCYILENENYVFSVLDFQRALGYEGKAQSWFSQLLMEIRKFLPINQELAIAFSQPKYFETFVRGKRQLQAAFDASLIKQACNIVVEANIQGYLSVSQVKFARHAQAILKFLDNQNIFVLIEEVTGFALFTERVKILIQDRLETISGEPAFLWLNSIPSAMISANLKMYDKDWKTLSQKLESFDHFFIDTIFSRIPLATYENMRQVRPKRSYRRGGITYPASHEGFSLFLSELMTMLETAAYNRNIFRQLLNRSFPKIRAYNMIREKSVEVSNDALDDFGAKLERGLHTFKLVSHRKKEM